MKILRLALLTLLILAAHSKPCNAQVFHLTANSPLSPGSPSSIYEVNPGDTARVGVGSSSVFTCRNMSPIIRTAQITDTITLSLYDTLTLVNVFNEQSLEQTTKVLTPNVLWSKSRLYLVLDDVSVGGYTAKVIGAVTETGTGTQQSNTSTKSVTVRPYA